jgi:hypothetical protein
MGSRADLLEKSEALPGNNQMRHLDTACDLLAKHMAASVS